jgi:glycosyltransferase involved in cell wall biosynthesis
MLGVVIPAHNEEALIEQCLRSIIHAAAHPALEGEQVEIYVVTDSCTDRTPIIARNLNVQVIPIHKRNVGAARASGASTALAQGARWLSFTDADTTVAGDWLVQQLRRHTDVVCGVISVEDWTGHSDAVRQNFVDTYCDANGHRHIHGANLGLTASAYRRVGGFQPHTSNEDVALVEALIGVGATISWSAEARVVTSARLDSRAPSGFGAALYAASFRLGAYVTCRTQLTRHDRSHASHPLASLDMPSAPSLASTSCLQT